LETITLNTGILFLSLVGGGAVTPPNPLIAPVKPTTSIVQQVEKPQPVEYIVVDNDNLTKIADKYQTTWQRLYQKNTDLTNQDLINVGQKLIIPTPDEVLADRPITYQSEHFASSQSLTIAHFSGNTAGNTYDYGYCTWYGKNRRPDLPNNLGNANTWYYMAQADGLATGTTPRAGAIGATTAGSLGHIVYVEAVNGDGTITISEMNYKGWGIQSSRVASAGAFFYIY